MLKKNILILISLFVISFVGCKQEEIEKMTVYEKITGGDYLFVDNSDFKKNRSYFEKNDILVVLSSVKGFHSQLGFENIYGNSKHYYVDVPDFPFAIFVKKISSGYSVKLRGLDKSKTFEIEEEFPNGSQTVDEIEFDCKKITFFGLVHLFSMKE